MFTFTSTSTPVISPITAIELIGLIVGSTVGERGRRRRSKTGKNDGCVYKDKGVTKAKVS